MDPFLIGALGSLGSAAIGGIGSLISSGKANENAIYMQRIQNNFNKQQATTSWKRAVDMWNRQNVYNSPKEQMNRLLQANLNPNLMYGQGSVGNASSSPSPDTPRGVELPNSYRYDNGVGGLFSSIADSINSYVSMQRQIAEIDQLKANKNLTDTTANLRKLDAISREKNNAKSDVELKYLDEIYQAQLRQMDNRSILDRANAEFVDQRRLQFAAERPLRLQMLEQSLNRLSFLNSLNPLTRQHLIFRIGNLSLQMKGRELENHITNTLIKSGVNLRGGALERGVNMIMDIIESGDFSLNSLGKAVSVGALGFLTK
nr:MAG: DNA pilot protein [Microvirus sp.]